MQIVQRGNFIKIMIKTDVSVARASWFSSQSVTVMTFVKLLKFSISVSSSGNWKLWFLPTPWNFPKDEMS